MSARFTPFSRAGRGAFRALALAGLVCAFSGSHARAQSTQTNPISQFPVKVDGLFTSGVPNPSGQFNGEWGDVNPLAFISPATAGGTLLRTDLTDPNANSLLYAALAPEAGGNPSLYLMYDYKPRTDKTFNPGDFIGDVSFPIHVPSGNGAVSGRTPITVQFRGADSTGQAIANSTSFFAVTVVDDQGNAIKLTDDDLEGAVGFGPSTLSSGDHLLIELEVSLRIPPGFGTDRGPLNPGGNGINPATGLYDPNPAFWGSGIAKNGTDPPASSALFRINPDGSTFMDSGFVPAAVPEPSGLLLAGAGLVSLFCVKRRAKVRK